MFSGRNVLLWLLAALLLAETLGAAPDPRDLIIYQVITDRFDDGDPSNNTASPRGNYAPADPRGLHGGDFKGIERRLDYIAALGANAIWISPFLENAHGEYHGYGTYDWYAIDPHWGTEDDLVDMIDAAHARGIAVYFDMICNHASGLIGDHNAYRTPPDSYPLAWNSGLRYPPPFDSLDDYHAQGNINNFAQPEEVLGELFGLDDIKTESPAVRDDMAAIWTYWMDLTGVDGFRVDTVKHVDRAFWQDLFPRLRTHAQALGLENFFIFGEVYSGDDSFCRNYVGTLGGGAYSLDGVLDFGEFFTTNQVFATATGATSMLTDRVNSKVANYGANFDRIPTWLDSHDQSRFLNVAQGSTSAAEATLRLKVAATYHLTTLGPPIIYYGTEQGFNGGGDPNDREDMFDGQFEQGPSLGDNFNTGSELYAHFRTLCRARNFYPALRRGTYHVYAQDTGGPGAYAFARRNAGEEVLVMLNTSASPTSVGSFATSFAPGTQLADLLDPAAPPVVVDAGGTVPGTTLAGYARRLYARADDLPPSGPLVIKATPGDNATVDVTATVSVSFSAAMDRATVETAFALADAANAAVAGTFIWNAEATEFEFLPASSLASASAYTLTLGVAARSAAGVALELPLSIRFQTTRAPRAPEPPASCGTLYFLPSPPAIDGAGGDWSPGGPQDANTTAVGAASVLRYVDAVGDDAGDGNYAYPQNTVFTGGDADLAEFRFAHDAAKFYFYFRPVSVNPAASFFTPYFGVVLRFEAPMAHAVAAPGINTLTRAVGRAEVDLSALPGDMEVVLAGLHGGACYLENVEQPAPQWSFSYQTGEVELAVTKPVGLPAGDYDATLFVYTALETFADLREVQSTRADYDPGGADFAPQSPDVFDLAGASSANQASDLADYTEGGFATRPVHSFLRATIANREAPANGETWFVR